ncbi:MAG: helicase [Phormidesmis priestleyi]|uniref:Helicase n=1 Tax=Phormidesmis priestleyi TaxID=268141 RepID=A0A2W4XXJ7_9CYAN|nr:MAG: helicase [Phormidesmis priestleyi]
MIETEVHQRLRAYLQAQGQTQWPHHLTMARLVARALRVGRSALMQVDSLAAYQGSYRLSYLIPALLWPEPAILALPEKILETVLWQDIPNLQQGLPVVKAVCSGDRWPTEGANQDPNSSFRGLLVTSAEAWLRDRLTPNLSPQTPRFPPGIVTLIDGVSDLERWARSQLSHALCAQDWDLLMLAYPNLRDRLRDFRVRLTHAVFQHPVNPYGAHLIEAPEKALLNELIETLEEQGEGDQMPLRWARFWQQFLQPERLAWASLDRTSGSVTLHCAPAEICHQLASVWAQQPVVLIGAALDPRPKAEQYRDRLGLGEMTCLSFGPDRHHDSLQLYVPDHLPMPNTSQFKAAALQEIRALLSAQGATAAPTVIIIGDVPLRDQFAAILAAEFGSRVRVESPVEEQGILITGWEYWRSHRAGCSTGLAAHATAPGLLIITTLPIPSLENPLVAGRVASYKRRRQDWFKAYLLPSAISELQQAVAPVRSRRYLSGQINDQINDPLNDHSHREPSGGIVALLDNRLNYRSYGHQILAALEPALRSSHLNEEWFIK